MIVEDDGAGFPFAGRFSQAELDAMGKGPVVIKERVHLIEARTHDRIEYRAGSRLEIKFRKSGKRLMDNRRSQTVRILIADDHPIFRDGLRRLLEAEPIW